MLCALFVILCRVVVKVLSIMETGGSQGDRLGGSGKQSKHKEKGKSTSTPSMIIPCSLVKYKKSFTIEYG